MAQESKTFSTNQLLAFIGKSRSFLYTNLLPDTTFPQPFRLGERALSWLRADIETWIEAKAAAVNGV